MGEVQAAAGALGLEVVALEIRQAAEIAPAVETIKGRVDALYVAAAPLLTTNRVRINTLALAARLPTMHSFREWVEAAGLMSYGANLSDLFRRAADRLNDEIDQNFGHVASAVNAPVNAATTIRRSRSRTLPGFGR